MGLGTWFRNEWWEAKEAGKEIKHFIKTHDWRKSARNSVRRKYWRESHPSPSLGPRVDRSAESLAFVPSLAPPTHPRRRPPMSQCGGS